MVSSLKYTFLLSLLLASSVLAHETPFSVYRDNYLLGGWNNSDLNRGFVVKFQISAKLKTPIPGLYLAYSQRSFWDILEESYPFYDHNFQPEVYYAHSFSEKFSSTHGLRNIRIGYAHESNGLSLPDSRSWDRAYGSAEFVFSRFYFTPTIWLPFFLDDGNPDLRQYFGYGQLEFGYIWENDIRFVARVRPGTRWPRGNIKTDMTIPFHIMTKSLPKSWSRASLWIQVWHGYGESLVGYRESATAVAVGFGFRPDFESHSSQKKGAH